MYEYGTWRPLLKKSLGLFTAIDKQMHWTSSVDPSSLPNLHTSPTLFIASDYSGEHASADYQTISIVITDVNAINDWNQHRLRVRERYLSDGRRMSFKQLRDQRRWQALGSFLSAADKLRGLSATVAIHSSIDTLFTGIDPLDLSNRDFAKFSHWNKRSLEKLLVVCQLLCKISASGCLVDETGIVSLLKCKLRMTA